MSAHAKEILANYGLAPSKKRGQNFLKHASTAENIVARAGFLETDHVVEVGVGLGALTSHLAKTVAQVTGIEVDRGIISYHQKSSTLPDNVELIHQDVLRTDFSLLHEKVGTPLKIISNLPYSISNPFIFRLIENRHRIERVVILLQKEMAQRLLAVPQTKEYGIPTILLQTCAEITRLLQVRAAEFYPRPKVDSLLIEISFHSDPLPDGKFDLIRDTVRAAFSSRRKTLVNNLLSSHPGVTKMAVDKQSKRKLVVNALNEAGLRENIRAEDVSVESFQLLARKLENLG